MENPRSRPSALTTATGEQRRGRSPESLAGSKQAHVGASAVCERASQYAADAGRRRCRGKQLRPPCRWPLRQRDLVDGVAGLWASAGERRQGHAGAKAGRAFDAAGSHALATGDAAGAGDAGAVEVEQVRPAAPQSEGCHRSGRRCGRGDRGRRRPRGLVAADPAGQPRPTARRRSSSLPQGWPTATRGRWARSTGRRAPWRGRPASSPPPPRRRRRPPAALVGRPQPAGPRRAAAHGQATSGR